MPCRAFAPSLVLTCLVCSIIPNAQCAGATSKTSNCWPKTSTRSLRRRQRPGPFQRVRLLPSCPFLSFVVSTACLLPSGRSASRVSKLRRSVARAVSGTPSASSWCCPGFRSSLATAPSRRPARKLLVTVVAVSLTAALFFVRSGKKRYTVRTALLSQICVCHPSKYVPHQRLLSAQWTLFARVVKTAELASLPRFSSAKLIDRVRAFWGMSLCPAHERVRCWLLTCRSSSTSTRECPRAACLLTEVPSRFAIGPRAARNGGACCAAGAQRDLRV
jgi:hypothetical protein